MHITPESCAKMMATCTLSRRAALATEMAVGVAVFAVAGNADLEARKELEGLYEKAESDTNEFTGQSYRTIRRRIDAAASLYERLGQAKIEEVVGVAKNIAAITAIQIHVASLNLYSINAIFVFCDKPIHVPRTVVQLPPLPKWRVIHTAHIELEITPEVTAQEAEELAQKLHAVAERLRKQELKAA